MNLMKAMKMLFAGFFLLMACSPSGSMSGKTEMNVWCIHDMVKIDPTTGKAHEDNSAMFPEGLAGDYQRANYAWDSEQGTVKLQAAQNEVVAFQIILEPNQPVKGVTFRASELSGPDGSTIPAENISMFREWYMEVKNSGLPEGTSLGDGWYPDALIPLEMGTERYGAPLDIPDLRNKVPEQKNQAIWVDLYVPEQAAAGTYSGSIEIGGPVEKSIRVELEVLNFKLPNTFHYMMCLNNYGNINRMPMPMRIKYYQLMQKHRIYVSNDAGRDTPDLNVETGEIDWTEFDKNSEPFLDGSAFTDKYNYGPGPMQGTPLVMQQLPFEAGIPRYTKHSSAGAKGWPLNFIEKAHTPEYDKLFIGTLKAFKNHFEEKGWTNTTYIVYCNGADEPTHLKEYEDIRYLGMLVQNADVNPLIQFKVDIGNFSTVTKKVPEFKSLQQMIDFLDPAIDYWVCNGALYSVEHIQREIAKGRSSFYYGTNHPPGQGGSFVDSESMGARVWALIAARYGLNGGEIWHFMFHFDDAWDGKPTDAKRSFYGYAQHIYPDKGLGVDFGEPIASIRLKGFRRGQQDAEYVWLARQGNDSQKALAEEVIDEMIPAALNEVKGQGAVDAEPGKEIAEIQGNKVDPAGLWPHNPERFEQLRRELGQVLSDN